MLCIGKTPVENVNISGGNLVGRFQPASARSGVENVMGNCRPRGIGLAVRLPGHSAKAVSGNVFGAFTL